MICLPSILQVAADMKGSPAVSSECEMSEGGESSGSESPPPKRRRAGRGKPRRRQVHGKLKGSWAPHEDTRLIRCGAGAGC